MSIFTPEGLAIHMVIHQLSSDNREKGDDIFMDVMTVKLIDILNIYIQDLLNEGYILNTRVKPNLVSFLAHHRSKLMTFDTIMYDRDVCLLIMSDSVCGGKHCQLDNISCCQVR